MYLFVYIFCLQICNYVHEYNQNLFTFVPLGISQEEPRKTATTTLQISIKDLNDNAPIFELSTYNASVRESLPIGKWIKRSDGRTPNIMTKFEFQT